MANKLTTQEMQDIAESRGGECLSTVYINSSSHLTWECGCGNIWEAIPANIKSGRWCAKCGAKKSWNKRTKPSLQTLHQLATERSMLFLSSSYEDSKTKYLWKCPNGHQFNATYSNVKFGKGCPYCKAL